MTVRRTTWAVVSLALLASLLAMGAQRQAQRGRVSFPRLLPKDADSLYDQPLWIDASELLTRSGDFRRSELEAKMPGAAAMLEHLALARADGTYRGGGDCFETGTAMGPLSQGPPRPVNMVDLEILAEAIIYGRIVGAKPGFLRGRGFGLYEIEVLEVLKGAETIGERSSVFLFWPETRFDFVGYCIQWTLAPWPFPMPEVGREILLTPMPGLLETIAGSLAIVAWTGAEAIYEVRGGLAGVLDRTLFPEAFSDGTIGDLEIVRRLRAERR